MSAKPLSQLSADAQQWNAYYEFVEQGGKTPADLVANFKKCALLVRTLGERINNGWWSIEGVESNSKGYNGEGTNERELNRQLGELVLAKHNDKPIKVDRKFKRSGD